MSLDALTTRVVVLLIGVLAILALAIGGALLMLHPDRPAEAVVFGIVTSAAGYLAGVLTPSTQSRTATGVPVEQLDTPSNRTTKNR